MTNQTLLQCIKKRLGKAKDSWADKLHHIRWAYQTTKSLDRRDSSAWLSKLKLWYPLRSPISVSQKFRRVNQIRKMTCRLGPAGPEKEDASKWQCSNTKSPGTYFNSKVWNKTFRVNDLVLYQVQISQPSQRGKLSPNQKRPYQVEEVFKPGTYRLKWSNWMELLCPNPGTRLISECITSSVIPRLNKNLFQIMHILTN